MNHFNYTFLSAGIGSPRSSALSILPCMRSIDHESASARDATQGQDRILVLDNPIAQDVPMCVGRRRWSEYCLSSGRIEDIGIDT